MNTALFLDSAIEHLQEGVQRISRCLDQLTHEQIWHDHNSNLVSVGNLILHLQGNVSQYIILGIGARAYERQRDAEFTAKPDLSAAELLREISGTVDLATAIIRELTDQELDREVLVQGFHHTGTSSIVHVVEHFSYHVGQITFAVKFLKDIDLGYYAGRDLNLQ